MLHTDVTNLSVDAIIPYSNNPKEHPDEQVQKIASSIKNYGWDQPIVVDESNEIIKGHGRLQAAKLLDLDEVPVIKRTDLSDAEKRASRIADNKTAESDWSDDDLTLELEQLEQDDFDLDLTGFDEEEIDDLLETDNADLGDENNRYTDKINTPVYEPTGEEPSINELYDADRYQELIQSVEAADIDDELREFLRFAAHRHIVFDYENIAEFYAHQDTEIQELMEMLTLVIIDYDQAVEQGFVKFAKQILGDDNA